MPKIISFLSEKGGSGKTTLATNIACAFQRYYNNDCNQTVMVADADPMGSSRDWNEASNGSMVPVFGLDRDTLQTDIQNLGYRFENIIIDGAPRIAKTTAAAIRISDLVIIPVQPSPYDIWACSDLIDLIKARQEVTEGFPMTMFLISRKIKGTKLGEEVFNELLKYGILIMSACTTQRVSYPTTARKGLSVYQSADNEAINEIDSIYNEIIMELNKL